MAVTWLRELGPAVARARTEGKPLFIDFYSDTCLGCRAMEARTYVQNEAAELVEREFVAVKLHVKEPKAEFRELLRMAKPLFTPLLLFLDAGGTELRRTTGFLPPPELDAELRLVLGFADLLHTRFAEAHARFREVVEREPEAHVAPEALYWAGVAAYRLNGRGLEGLAPEWAELRRRYPASAWALRADCLGEPAVLAG
jgi:thiol-disulfide isomerase/thioredoxin